MFWSMRAASIGTIFWSIFYWAEFPVVVFLTSLVLNWLSVLSFKKCVVFRCFKEETLGWIDGFVQHRIKISGIWQLERSSCYCKKGVFFSLSFYSVLDSWFLHSVLSQGSQPLGCGPLPSHGLFVTRLCEQQAGACTHAQLNLCKQQASTHAHATQGVQDELCGMCLHASPPLEQVELCTYTCTSLPLARPSSLRPPLSQAAKLQSLGTTVLSNLPYV